MTHDTKAADHGAFHQCGDAVQVPAVVLPRDNPRPLGRDRPLPGVDPPRVRPQPAKASIDDRAAAHRRRSSTLAVGRCRRCRSPQPDETRKMPTPERPRQRCGVSCRRSAGSGTRVAARPSRQADRARARTAARHRRHQLAIARSRNAVPRHRGRPRASPAQRSTTGRGDREGILLTLEGGSTTLLSVAVNGSEGFTPWPPNCAAMIRWQT